MILADMSVVMTRAVRSLQMPSSPKAVLLALADYADDNGHAWPSIPKLCEFTCLCERSVHAAVKWLESHRVIRCDKSNGRHTQYVLTPAAFAVVEATVSPAADAPPQQMTPAADAATPAADAVQPPQMVQSPPQQMRSNHQELPKQPPRTTKADSTVDLPDWLPLVEWRAFVEMRKRIRKPLTDHAAKLAISKLDELRLAGDAPADVLNASVMGSWQGLFPVKKQSSKPSRLSTPAPGTNYGGL